jgi:hypothetical protein
MKKPRKPTREEAHQLAGYVHHKCGCTETPEEAELWTKETCIAVFDDYVSDCPGYAGKLMMVVWGAGPRSYQVYIWRYGKLTHVNQDPGLRSEEEG